MTRDLVLVANCLFIASHVALAFSLPTTKDIIDSDREEVMIDSDADDVRFVTETRWSKVGEMEAIEGEQESGVMKGWNSGTPSRRILS